MSRAAYSDEKPAEFPFWRSPNKVSTYRPDIDGLRAIAVLVVLGYHAFPDLVTGGFVGVDIFFVISGTLITGLILQELEREEFRFANFYARRVKRIFPALILVLTASFAFGWALLVPTEFVSLGRNIAGGAAFSSNFVLYATASYFEIAAERQPLLHLWSLGIEEQFYIFWPLLVVFTFKRGRDLLRWSVAIGAASFVLNLATVAKHPASAFYLPFARAWELLLGAFLACIAAHSLPTSVSAGVDRTVSQAGVFLAKYLARKPEKAGADLRAWIGAALILGSVAVLHRYNTFPGWRALPPTMGAFLLISARDSWFNRQVLASRAFVFIGLISYPLYLWHWPLLSFARIAQTGPLSVPLTILALLVSFVLAWLTYVLIEKPVRSGGSVPLKIASLSALISVLGCIGLLTVAADGFDIRIPPDMRATFRSISNVGVNLQQEWRLGTCLMETDGNRAQFAESCVDSERRPLIFVWGDSVAAALYPGLRHAQGLRDFGIGQITTAGCPPILRYISSERPSCKDNNDFAVSLISMHKPNVVVLHSTWNYPSANLDNLAATISELRRVGAFRIVIVGPPVDWNEPLPQLILRYFANSNSVGPQRSRAYLRYFVRGIDQSLQQKARAWGVEYISIWDAMCNLEGCLMRVGAQARDVTTFDNAHLTVAGSIFLADMIMPRLLDAAPP